MKAWTGQGLDRVDARLKVTGKAVYSAEVAVAHAAHAVIVGSTAARGKILAIDRARAEQAPGVLAVLTHENAPRLAEKGETGDRVLQLLQGADVLYDGQPVAMVVADTLERARHAAALVEIRYRQEPARVRIEDEKAAAYAPAKAVRDPTDTNRGDFDRAFAEADVRVEQTYVTPVQHHNPMELHATTAVWHGAERLTLYDATQGITRVQTRMAKLFGLAPDKVRVISHFLGGGFGGKGSPWSHVALTAMAAKVVGRPVKLMLTRQQMFAFVGYRPRTTQAIALGARRDGTLTAMRHDVFAETSRFDEFVEGAAVATRILYACPNVRTTHRLVRLDVATPTFTRAPGKASGSFALEVALDELSQELRMNPLALRLANYAEKDPESGKPWSSKALRECYEQGARRFGWPRGALRPRSRREGKILVGWGMATAAYPAGQSASSAEAKLRADGTALVQAGSQELGTGTYTIMTQIAADGLGLPVDRVRFELGDTALPEAPLSAGSRTATSVGSAVQMAAKELVRKLAALAAADAASPLHAVPVESIGAGDGALYDRRNPAKREAYTALLARAGQKEIGARVRAEEHADRQRFETYAFGAQFAEVRVDEDLGEIRVSRMVGAFAAGKILNAKTAHSQLVGGMVWAIGLALHEHTERDPRSGRIVTRDLVDYHVPVNADVPELDVVIVPEEDPHVSQLGAKGVGEIGITGGVAAIANAIFDATGQRVRELPITLDKLLPRS